MKRDIGFIGAPGDAGANRPGASQAPAALRAAGLPQALHACQLSVHDAGDLPFPAGHPMPETPGYHQLPQVVRWARATHDAVLAELTRQRLPVLLGGDHSLSIGSLSAVARHCRQQRRPLRVLWLDAHADCNTHATSPSGNLHGMPVACLCGRGPQALTVLAGAAPAVAPAAMRLFGVRRIDPREQEVLDELDIEVFDMARIRALGLREAMTRALAGMGRRAHLHLSLDIDALDPALAPGVSVPEPGGLGQADILTCMAMIAASGHLGSLDVMEFNPLRERERTAAAVIALLRALLCPARSRLHRLHAPGPAVRLPP